MPPIELVTPPSLRNLSLEEENNEVEHKATMWEANVAKTLDPLPRSCSPYPKKTSTLEDLETDTDDNMVDMTDIFKRPPNKKRSPRPKQANSSQEQCPTPQNSPTHTPTKLSVNNTTCQATWKWNSGNSPRQKKSTLWMASLSQKAATQGSFQKQWYLHHWWWRVQRTEGKTPQSTVQVKNMQ